MKTTIAMLLAVAVLAPATIPTPAAAGWCIEACGLRRVVRPPPQTREVVCTTVRRGNVTQTVCTRS